MKKRITALIIVLCVLAAAFGLFVRHLMVPGGDAVSVGIIGAADGPTSIFVSNPVNGGLCLALLIIGIVLVAVLFVNDYRKKHVIK